MENSPNRLPISMAALPWFAVAVSLSTFMEVLDTSIANVAVPSIAGDLGVTANEGTWIISSYSLAAAIVVPLTGWIVQRFGQVRTFVASVLLFTLMSALCGLAGNLHLLAVFRFLQGFVSGPMVPLSQALLISSFPPSRRGLALALWSMTIVIAPVLGPLLGGYITDNSTWRWIFFINIPIGLASAAAVFGLLRKHREKTARLPVDFAGLAMLAVGVGSLQLMLDNGNDLDWFNSNVIVALAITAVISLTLFIAWEMTDQSPIVDITLFRNRNFTLGVASMSLAFMGFFAIVVLFPLWLQTTMGYTATLAGIATAPIGVLALIISPIIGKNLHRLDSRVVISVGFLIFSYTGYLLAQINLDASFPQMLFPRFIQGAAVACFFIPINDIIISTIPAEKVAAASGLSNFFRTLSGSIATAVSVAVWDRRSRLHGANLTEHISGNNLALSDYVQTLVSHGFSESGAYAAIGKLIDQQSATLATREIYMALSVLFIVLIAPIWLTKPAKRQSPVMSH